MSMTGSRPSPAGSYLVICHASDGENPDAAAAAPRAFSTATSGLSMRSPG